MDVHPSNGGTVQPSREPAHSHHRSGGFVTPSYSSTSDTQSSCAGGSGNHLNDSSHGRSSYSTSSRQSPSRLSGSTSTNSATAVPPPRSSDVRHQAALSNAYSASYTATDFAAPQSSSTSSTAYQETQKSSSTPEPPKKPLSPYMRFSKSIWFQVKAANPSLSVCQIGATIGRMWRELSDAEKQHHLEDFNQDKVRYDNELKRYMKSTGLRAKDLRAMARTQPKAKNRNRSKSSSSAPSSNQTPSSTASSTNPQLAQAATFMGIPISAGVPMSMLGAAAGAMSMLPPHFTQVWPGGQQYAGQPMVGIATAGQLQLAAAAQPAQGLYSNGYTLGNETASSTSKQAMASRDAQSSSPMYRYAQNYL